MAGNDQSPGSKQKLLLGVSGGIACYKACAVVSRLTQTGWDVKVMMTDAATRFVTPITFEALSGNHVYTSLWETGEFPHTAHIELARWADRVLIAPATANLIGKLANGLCDDLVSTVLTAVPRDTPRHVAPAMNADMWANPIVQRNVKTLRDELGYQLIGPAEGWQACRTAGAGRMAEAEEIVEAMR